VIRKMLMKKIMSKRENEIKKRNELALINKTT
jgi:hypothetical protein